MLWALVVLLVTMGACVTPMYDIAAFYLPTLPQRELPAVGFALVVMLIHVVGLVIHELGHVLAAVQLSGHLEKITISGSLSVLLSLPRERTNADQWYISFGGPGLQLIFASVLISLATTTQPASSVLLLSGCLVALEAVGNLLVPTSANSDAAKLYRATWQCLRGRAYQPFHIHTRAYLEVDDDPAR